MQTLKYAVAVQNASIEQAVQNGAEWTGRELTILSELRAANVPVAEIAEQLRRSYYAVASKIQAAGLAQRTRQGKIEVIEVCPQCWLDHAGDCL